MYKLIKLTRLLRLLKVMRDRNRLLKYLSDFFRFGLGFERLFFFILLFLMLVHILACLFIFVAQGDDNSLKDSWADYYYNQLGINYTEVSDVELYVTSVYWTCTTIATVGYGDIIGTNTLERIFCSVCMIIGVISFTFANGSFASIL